MPSGMHAHGMPGSSRTCCEYRVYKESFAVLLLQYVTGNRSGTTAVPGSAMSLKIRNTFSSILIYIRSLHLRTDWYRS